MKTIIEVEKLSFYYGKQQILDNISVGFDSSVISAIVGPSGSGKSTFLMTINRLWEELNGATMGGRVSLYLENQKLDIYSRDVSLSWLRRKVGMVFQIPNPLPMSIYRNLALPLRMAGLPKESFAPKIETVLKQAFLWSEVKDRLRDDARNLSGGQQQRLCIARAMILEPVILLLDEPTSSLDEKAAREIELLLLSLKEQCAQLMVSHDQAQVKRVAGEVMEMVDGRMQV
ncbi:MAG: phosphate ABC transporter ATP-binding protein [Deltaproteobacteria bacterium]|nr:MAG: phosphate ABC transporter ATP-binding protein [Deltaproteobacteria bacterium]